jgi:hypothetical protein
MPLVKLKSGETREYSEKDARLLVLVKRGVLVNAEIKSKPIKAEDSDELGDEKPKRTYKTKVLKAD